MKTTTCDVCGEDESNGPVCDRDKCQEIFWRERAIANPWPADSSAKQSTKSKGEE